MSTSSSGPFAAESNLPSHGASLDRLWAALIIIAGLWIYWPVLTGDWLWDDNLYITENKLIQNPHGFWEVLIAPDGQEDHDPLTSAVSAGCS